MASPSSSPPPSPEPAAGLGTARRGLLLGSVFVIAACGLVYELIAGALSSYLLGDPVLQFSLVVGVFLSAMGLGSYLAKFVRRDLLGVFVEVQLAIGLFGGVSSLALFAVYALIPGLFSPFFYGLCVLLGALVGVEIPLLVRILEGTDGLRAALSHVLAVDYLGALAGSLAFPLLVLPYLGLSRASVVFGVMNLAVAGLAMAQAPGRRAGSWLRLLAAGVVLTAAFFASTRLVGLLEDLIYQDSVIYARQTAHQRIVITRWRDDVRLYLDGHIQFSSIDEARYHEALVIPALEALPRPRSVLILGGGDGLAAREVLKYQSVERITLVDLDPVVTDIAATRPELVALNGGSLGSDRVTIVNRDAFAFLQDDRGFYDAIIADLPDPHGPALAKLYSTAAYALAARRLALGGVFVTQATSPYLAPEAYWCIVNTLAAAGGPQGALTTWPYHVNVPSFGEWGFVLASRRRIDPAELAPSVPTRFLDAPVLASLFLFPRDMPHLETELNRLDDPVLYRYYETGWNRYNE